MEHLVSAVLLDPGPDKGDQEGDQRRDLGVCREVFENHLKDVKQDINSLVDLRLS